MKTVAIIGAGAAGCMAAGIAARNGNKVLLFDTHKRIGRKILVTGKGRCNVTCDYDEDGFLKNIPRNPRFLYSAIHTLNPYTTRAMFEDLGLALKTERGKRVFPESNRAIDVVDALYKHLDKNGVSLISEKVLDVIAENKIIKSVITINKTYDVDSVIIATGGLSYPKTGSTGDGYKFAQNLGHNIIKTVPSLSGLIGDVHLCKSLQGLALKNIGIKLLEDGKEIHSAFGEMLFTHFGVSGPLILSASAHRKDGKKYDILIDLKPALDIQTLDARLLRDFENNKNKDFMNALGELLPRKIISAVIKKSGIDMNKKVHSITKQERQALIHTLKNFKINIETTMPIDEAIVTRGGIDTKEISPKDMQSKIISGLYFAGEIIDVDGYTGGFNLQIAWCTGYLAGDSI